MAATRKINFLTLVSYSQYETLQTTNRQTTQCTKGVTDSTVGQ